MHNAQYNEHQQNLKYLLACELSINCISRNKVLTLLLFLPPWIAKRSFALPPKKTKTKQRSSSKSL